MRVFACIIVFLAFYTTGCKPKLQPNEYSRQSQIIDSLLNESNNNNAPLENRLFYVLRADSLASLQNNGKHRLICIRQLATLYLQLGETHKAWDYFTKTRNLAETLGDKESLAIALSNIGLIFNKNSEYDSAFKYLTDAQSIFQIIGKQSWIAASFVNLGIVYKNQGNFEEAFKINLDAVKIFESEGIKTNLAPAYTTLGNILKELNRLDDALNYHKRALAILEEEHDTLGMALSLNNIGNVYRYKKEYKKALSIYFISLELKEKFGNEKTIATTVDNIGEVYLELKDFKNAESNFKRALLLRSISEDKDGFLTTSNRLSKLYLGKNDVKNAKLIALAAYNASPHSGLLKQRMENNLILYEIYLKIGQYRAAIAYSAKMLELKDSLFNTNMANAISRMSVKFNTEQKEKENAILKRNNIIKESKINEQRQQNLLLIISGLSTFIVLSSFVYLYRKKKIYQFKKETASLKQEALNAQMSDHFIGNTMDSINNFIRNNEKDKASEYLILFSRLIRKVLENAPSKCISLNEDLGMLKDYLELEALRFPTGKLEYEFVIDNGLNTENVLVPPMIFQVLTENAIKHGFKKSYGGKLKIVISCFNEQLQCIVEDNGIGRLAASGETAGRDNRRASFGGSLAERLIKITSESEHKTSFDIIDLTDDNNNATGTQVVFTIPLMQMG